MRKILIVDDAETNRLILTRILSDSYDIAEASNGDEALRILTNGYKSFSAVLLDILMPVMDGYEVLRQMRDNIFLAQIPVIMVTGINDEESRVRALSLGANDFVTKPYNPEILKHCLHNCIYLRETASIINAIQLDKLTGIYSREAFFENASVFIRNGAPGDFVMASLDIDNFKLVNDQCGAPEGDDILRHIGRIAKRTFERLGGLCGRISGDNFAAVYPNNSEAIEYITEIMESELTPQDCPVALNFSSGRYIINDLSLTVSSMYDRSYIAKQSVKGMYGKHTAYFDDQMLKKLVDDQQITNEMDKALREGQFEVWLQPQSNYASGALIGAEALVRWRHPEKGLISPGVFIPIFEENGFIYELDKFVWDATCALLRRWLDEGRNPLPVSVNISRCDILRDDLIDVIKGCTEKYSIPTELLRLEITESAFAQSSGQLIQLVKNLTESGFVVEIDDFGSGYSSLNTLKDVPADILKLDMKFLTGQNNSGRSGNILESIVRMAKWIGMNVIAEGVEDHEQAMFLKSVGCFYIQGYLYARPMPVSEYESFMESATAEIKMTSLETVDHLDNSIFWNPHSVETLIFNSYVGGACVIEYSGGKVELIRANDNYMREVGITDSANVPESSLEFTKSLDDDNTEIFYSCLRKAVSERGEQTCELRLSSEAQGGDIFLLFTARTIASSDDRYLLYCTVNNITAQCLTNIELENTNKLLKLVTDSIPGGIAVFSIENGNIRTEFYNDGFCKTLGYTRDEYRGICEESSSSLVLKEDLHIIYDNLKLLIENGRQIECNYRVRTKDGGIKWLKHRAALIGKTENRYRINSVFFDITIEHEMNEQIRIRDEEYRIALEESGSKVFRYNIESGSIQFASEIADYFCVPENCPGIPESVLKLGVIPQESQNDFRSFFERISAGNKSGKAVFQHSTTDGLKWIEASFYTVFSDSDKPMSAIISYSDVTKSLQKESVYKKWQQSLDERKPESFTLFRCNLSKNFSYESREGTLISYDFSGKTLSFDGYTEEYANRFVFDEDLERYVVFMKSDTLLASYYRGKRSSSIEYRERLADGGTRWIRLSADMVEYPNSTDIEIFLLYENIDITKRLDEETKFLARTDPLTGIQNRAYLIKNIDRAVRKANEDTVHALLLIDIDGFKAVNDVFGHAVGDRTLVEFADNVRTALRPEDSFGRLGGDEFLILLYNIGDEEKVRTLASSICDITRKSLDGSVEISASIGISMFPKDGTNFEALYGRADSALYSIKGSCKDNYAFYNEVLSNERGDAKKINPRLPSPPKKRMLIVDDNRIDALMLENIFKKDYLIEKVFNGDAALVRIKHYRTALSVIILDLIMPGTDGFDILKQLRESDELSQIPVVAISGSDMYETELEAIKLGASDFVSKPFDPELLKIRVDSSIAKTENFVLKARRQDAASQKNEIEKYRIAVSRSGRAVIEIDWITGRFSYDPYVSSLISGHYDERSLWRVFLSDMVTDTETVHRIQELLQLLAEDRNKTQDSASVILKTPSGGMHTFSLTVYKTVNDYGLTDRMILVFQDTEIDTIREAGDIK